MGWSNLFKGVPMPDKEDPKYKKQYEQAYNAGGWFARATGITWIGRKIINFAFAHKGLYLSLMLGLAIGVFLIQVGRTVIYMNSSKPYVPVTERVDSVLQDHFEQNTKTIKNQ